MYKGKKNKFSMVLDHNLGLESVVSLLEKALVGRFMYL
jgi:hypothetical protein